MHDEEKCRAIAAVELRNSHLLEWDSMKCIQKELKKDPQFFADMVSIIYKKDGDGDKKNVFTDEELTRVSNALSFYEKAEFCPAEENGFVHEDKLNDWVERLKELLTANNQSSLIGSLLGRLFSFSPVGEDGYVPCEAVRNMIEQYADDRLISEYHASMYNKRGLFTPSAGRSEKQIANRYKENADYLRTKWPKTAEVFDRLYRTYMREAETERRDAEKA